MSFVVMHHGVLTSQRHDGTPPCPFVFDLELSPPPPFGTVKNPGRCHSRLRAIRPSTP
jgi:hypothetical protein